MKDQSNFIKTIMIQDLESGKHKEILTRFPPEPNGFLHIGHARALTINFELAALFNGKTNLRFDDTNPEAEDVRYVNSIIEDINWLGFKPDKVLYASDYFQEMYERAVLLIKRGLAYVDDQTAEEISATRGNVTTPGVNSPYRDRTVEENLKLFNEMKEGKYAEGEKVLRAKIDMASPNMNMRDPVIYRITFAEHYRTGNKWCIYPLYDFAHPIEDAIEGITHSLCSLEFEDHRPLYDWVVEETQMESVPRQIEFGRLNIENTVMSKRYLKILVDEKRVTGWDDPRMPTLSGLRRRGYTPEAIKNFIISTGLSKNNSTVAADMLEAALRDDLQLKTPKIMGVINPLKVTVTNYPEGKVEKLTTFLNPQDESMGEKTIYFSRHLYIDRDDFILEKPNKHWKRLAKGIEVRLYNAYFIACHDVVYDEDGEIVEILVTYDEKTKSGTDFNERKPNGTIQYVEATTALKTTFNLFGPLVFDGEESFLERINPNSWEVKEGYIEHAAKDIKEQMQLMRIGYFIQDSKSEERVLNRIVELRSSFKK
ncbi:MAG TPA: glutamine--tRNA ligase/YqeY domain fusion protein [Acholeplasma sp.]|jgi:glutaminyl-tRNA synthetase|nr:glutamine--tRNA ligase/YqeY domain fusion protein [Acholeplasmatales bacterium]HHV33282.1 glutamine--tRNA ligase/YqeY domain fusion protein [Acholeplasma sp.]